MDNECADFRAKVTDDHDYKPYLDAVKDGYLKESDIDTALMRLFTARDEAGHVRSAGDGSVHEDRRERAGQRRASRAGAQAGQRVDGAAEERWRAAAEDKRSEDRGGGPAGRPDARAAGQLQRDSHAHGVDSGRPEGGIRRRHDQLYAGHGVPEQAGPAGAGRAADDGWASRA